MSTLTDTLVLPEPLASAPAGAYTEYRCRIISWGPTGPGRWHRCAWAMAWFDVKEQTPWRGEPLWLSATRRTDDRAPRISFTEKARAAIHAEVVPAIARYGFDRLWTELHRDKAGAGNRSAVVEARNALDWQQARADLHDLYAEGAVELVPVKYDARRPQQIRVVPEWRNGDCWEPVAARALVDGEQVGWMSDKARLYPLDDILR